MNRITVFKHYEDKYYEALVGFLIEVNKEKENLNWCWARLEWMIEHPFTKKELLPSIGLWFNGNHIVAATVFDMYFGECSCLCLKEYEYLYPLLVNYSYTHLKDENGLKISINANNKNAIDALIDQGFSLDKEQKEVMLEISLDQELDSSLPSGYHFEELDYEHNAIEIQWVLYRGFDHGFDYDEFQKGVIREGKTRPHFNKELSEAVTNSDGLQVGYCSLWYIQGTEFAYLEPLCIDPRYRNKGLAKSLIYHLLNKVKEMGAKSVVLISDMDFYKKIGFKEHSMYLFYEKK